MMTPCTRRHALLATALLSGALVLGCGGGGNSAATATDSVSLTETATRVTISSTGSQGSHQWSAMRFTFTADVTAGTNMDSTISGLLLLKGESDDEHGDDDDDDDVSSGAGLTEVEGRLFIGTLPMGAAADAAQGQALRSALRDQAETLRTAVRAELVKLHDQLKADLAAAPDDAAKQAAKQKFTDAFKALFDRFQMDMAALVTQLRDQLVALGLDPSRFLPGGKDGSRHGHGRGGFEVKGTIAADGRITGTVELGDDQVIQVTGQSQADGGFAGTFTGPAADDAGRWSATAVTAPMVPVPTPPASASGM